MTDEGSHPIVRPGEDPQRVLAQPDDQMHLARGQHVLATGLAGRARRLIDRPDRLEVRLEGSARRTGDPVAGHTFTVAPERGFVAASGQDMRTSC
jgi:hypothetical protein